MRRSLTALVSLLAACDPGDILLLAPETRGPAPTPSVRALIDTPYVATAAALGWSPGVPGAQVRLHLMSEPYEPGYWHVATADSTGIAIFPDLLGGLYEVEVTRTLTSAETAREGGAVRILAGGRRLHLPPGVSEATLAPDQRGALVFSELDLVLPPETETGGRTYPYGTYFEISNNSDTTVYLDGKYWGIGWDLNRDYPYWPCDQTLVVRNDPDGIWARYVYRFPGQGTEHGLAPGRTALIATSAIDHRVVLPTLPDLSHADFELAAHADNPDVPNLQDVGLAHMPMGGAIGTPTFLAEPVDLTTLPRYVDPYSGRAFVRIPTAHILDAMSVTTDWTTYSYEPRAACLEELHAAFERLPGPAVAWSDFDRALSIQRRTLVVLPDGRKVLQDTNTSMFDFVKAVRTPGWIPDSLP